MDEVITEILKNGEIFYNELKNEENSRYRSWEYCYLAFHKAHIEKKRSEETIDNLCLHLAFYLASWGMYRGSSFLLDKDYKVHKEVVKILFHEKYNSLWNIKTKKYEKQEYLDLLESLMNDIKDVYSRIKKSKDISLTLITKVLLGTMGCVPAYDRYFILAIKKYDRFNISASNYSIKSVIKSIGQLSKFYNSNSNFKEFETVRKKMKVGNLEYPEMKVVDMCFWQIGKEIYKEEENKKHDRMK